MGRDSHCMHRRHTYVEELKMVIYKILLFIAIALGTIGQLCLKHSVREGVVLRKGEIFRALSRIYFNLFFMLGALVYMTSMALFIIVISHIDLSYVYPIASINFVFVSISSKIVFKERISRLRWLSISVITLGVALISLS